MQRIRSGTGLSRLPPRPHPRRQPRVPRAGLQQGRRGPAHAAAAGRRRGVLPRRPALLSRVAVPEGRHRGFPRGDGSGNRPVARAVLRAVDLRLDAAALEVQLPRRPAAAGPQVVLHVEQIGEIFDLPVTVTLQYADGRDVRGRRAGHRARRRAARCRSPARCAASRSTATTGRWRRSSRIEQLGIGTHDSRSAPTILANSAESLSYDRSAYGNRHADDRRPAGHRREGQDRPAGRDRERHLGARTTAITPASASTAPAASASSRSRRCRSCRRRARRSAPTAWSCSTRTPEVVEARAGVFEFLLDQPPARLPGVRQGRRVSAAGFLVHVRTRSEPDGVSAARVRRRGREGRRRLRPDADAEPQPLHPLHAVRAVHARRRRRRADQHHRSRLRQRDRDVPGRGRALAASRAT